MNEKGISNPPQQKNWINGQSLTDEAWRWLTQVFHNYPKVSNYSVALNLANVVANTVSRQTFTVTGLNTNDIVIVNSPVLTTGLHMLGPGKVSANDTLELTFWNSTGSDINETSATYKIISIRL